MRIDVLTLFPEMFGPVLGSSILKRAAQAVPDPASPDDPDKVRQAVVSYHLHNIREWSEDAKHQKVDAPPYGGGPGMVMQCQPVWDAVAAVADQDAAIPLRILTTPKGQPLTQRLAERLAKLPRLMIVAGHYEGLDQRVIDRMHSLPAPAEAQAWAKDGLLEISVGDYVLSGGELPAMTLIDAVVRLLPGALGHAESAVQDSFSPGADRLLDHPHYTRPSDWDDQAVPGVLMSGDHGKIESWRAEQAMQTTRRVRPDLLIGAPSQANPAGEVLTVTLRDATPEDAEGIYQLHCAAFPTDAEAKLVRELDDAGHAMFSIVAETGARIVGHVLISEMSLADQRGVRGLMGVAPVAVDPALHRRGIGSALMQEAIRQCQSARVHRLFLLGDPQFYKRFGFQPALDLGYTSDYDPHTPPGSFQVLPIKNPRNTPPGHVQYPPPFQNL